jgi:beta-galactosidase
MSLTIAESPHSVPATIDRVLAVLEAHDIALFARVDHGGGARAAGLELADEELLIFGDPRVGTLLMQGDPRIGYELPLRLLVWDDAGHTRIGYRPPTELADDYGVADHLDVLERMDQLLQRIVAESVASA